MIGQQLLLSIRSLKKNLLYALFIVIGLAIGISTLFITFQWSAWHLTFDRSYPEREQIYRLTFEEDQEGFAALWLLVQRGSPLNDVNLGGKQADPLMLMAPALLFAAAIRPGHSTSGCVPRLQSGFGAGPVGGLFLRGTSRHST